ncbi:hypothetical protein B0H14DRAFT_3878102 [Mycena olivaceomarginata]|nr:hypothetical protein B0H14DRAFT_3878102 [Mycena olivaceomarginata]
MAKKVKTAKQNYGPYIAANVPDVMPFPSLAKVVKRKVGLLPVPNLNEYQRNWIHDIALNGVDLAAFQHTPEAGVVDDNAVRVSSMAKDWGKKGKSKGVAEDGDDTDTEDEDKEDKATQQFLLCGYPITGWETTSRIAATADAKGASNPAESAVAKLMGIVAYDGRSKFRDNRKAEIAVYAATIPGDSNMGGKMRQAEAALWLKADQAWWEAEARSDQGVDWTERQQLIPEGFNSMIHTLHAGGKFRPFMAMMRLALDLIEDWRRTEAVPDDIRVLFEFRETNKTLVQEFTNRMHDWAADALREYGKIHWREAPATTVVFSVLSHEVEELGQQDLTQKISQFYAESYNNAFGEGKIPWEKIIADPQQYYDRDGLGMELTGTTANVAKLYTVASALAKRAGAGSAGLFWKASNHIESECPKSPEHHKSPEREKTPEHPKSPECEKTTEREKMPECEKSPECKKSPEREKTQHEKTLEHPKSPKHEKTPEREKTPEHPKSPEREKTPERLKMPEPQETLPPAPPRRQRGRKASGAAIRWETRGTARRAQEEPVGQETRGMKHAREEVPADGTRKHIRKGMWF